MESKQVLRILRSGLLQEVTPEAALWWEAKGWTIHIRMYRWWAYLMTQWCRASMVRLVRLGRTIASNTITAQQSRRNSLICYVMAELRQFLKNHPCAQQRRRNEVQELSYFLTRQKSAVLSSIQRKRLSSTSVRKTQPLSIHRKMLLIPQWRRRVTWRATMARHLLRALGCKSITTKLNQSLSISKVLQERLEWTTLSG